MPWYQVLAVAFCTASSVEEALCALINAHSEHAKHLVGKQVVKASLMSGLTIGIALL